MTGKLTNGGGFGAPRTPDEIAVAGWGRSVTILVTALLLVESLTGLWIYLAPFSVASEIQLLLHTAAGLLIVGPYLYYQGWHLSNWWRQRVTAVMVLGYGLMVMTLVCAASGVVVTWQAWAGPKRSEIWGLVHLVSGLAIPALGLTHVLLAFLRRPVATTRTPEFITAVRRFGWGQALGVAATAALVLAAAALAPARRTDLAVPGEYSLSRYVEQFDEYRGSPFAPSYSRTASGGLVDPSVLAGSESCGSSRCHEQILREWQPSAHRFSAMNPPFQAVQKIFATDREPAETRYCAGCHDPISLFAGAKDIHNLEFAAPGMQEGSSCIVCHSISAVDQRGNGDYVLTPPRKYLWEGTTGWKKRVSDFMIRAVPGQHLADYDRNLLRSPEFCGACHKQFIPEALNRFGFAPGQNQYDEWRNSHWRDDEVEKSLSCRDCHMRLVPKSTDPGRGEKGDARRSPDDGSHRHHGTIATNMFMPAVLKLPGWETQVQLTREWIEGKTVIPEIAHLWPEGPIASVQLLGPPEARPGEEIALRVVVGNRKAGHNLITGPLDFMRAWVHLRVVDARGAVLFERGGIDPATREISDEPGQVHRLGNPRDEGTLVLEGSPIDGQGELLRKHELWESAGGHGIRVIFPGYSDHQIYRFTPPPGVVGPLSVRADFNFRRYRQEFLDLVVPTMEQESGVFQPHATQASAEIEIAVPGEVSTRVPSERQAREGR
ncbi:MAG: cytochrome b/b6 domain-containing protein [Gemmatimonadetes bacterium]|nr:cytochrome b/b6 domain-containing protein [Gemmatimonadota bacterium]